MEKVVTGRLWYLDRLPLYETTKPYIMNLPLSVIPPEKRTNQVSAAYDGIQIRDIRMELGSFSLDHQGFTLCTGLQTVLQYEDFNDPSKVSDIYCQEMMAGLQRIMNAERLKLFDVDTRASPAFQEGAKLQKTLSRSKASIVVGSALTWCGRMAVFDNFPQDYTPYEAFRCLQTLFGADTAKMFWQERRIQILQWVFSRLIFLLKRDQNFIINHEYHHSVWRPLSGPVRDWPLALCDTSTIDATSDLVAMDNVYSNTVSETYSVFYNPNHSWYYCAEQQSHEAFIFKGFDNAKDVASFCAHAAFDLENTTHPRAYRESIECAILLVYPQTRPLLRADFG